ncbi:hypothetical protein [Candidatus Methylobacter oryzae]|uniref:Uncharacterized protein n=1 Tax=Candidatus Methylobacter oryzae TaxID=2497749 RepID=A0ABY3C6A8_9GAMM|nr:hypothetical protein [Candidatus Methylobacter oryzae]TRW90622.1 hypothetical protein EKO24_018555 [Candidatus Methylobacter oryzae]
MPDKNEQDKASRFVQAVHGRRYVVSHGKLRLILDEYPGMPTEKIGYAEPAFWQAGYRYQWMRSLLNV